MASITFKTGWLNLNSNKLPFRPIISAEILSEKKIRLPNLGDLLARTWACTDSKSTNRSTRTSTLPPLAFSP